MLGPVTPGSPAAAPSMTRWVVLPGRDQAQLPSGCAEHLEWTVVSRCFFLLHFASRWGLSIALRCIKVYWSCAHAPPASVFQAFSIMDVRSWCCVWCASPAKQCISQDLTFLCCISGCTSGERQKYGSPGCTSSLCAAGDCTVLMQEQRSRSYLIIPQQLGKTHPLISPWPTLCECGEGCGVIYFGKCCMGGCGSGGQEGQTVIGRFLVQL